jgi:hypothetical protein
MKVVKVKASTRKGKRVRAHTRKSNRINKRIPSYGIFSSDELIRQQASEIADKQAKAISKRKQIPTDQTPPAQSNNTIFGSTPNV